ncbi:hypothetical protein PTKIN_Ptkin10aG0076300 [Pterospermum kingtungense]
MPATDTYALLYALLQAQSMLVTPPILEFQSCIYSNKPDQEHREDEKASVTEAEDTKAQVALSLSSRKLSKAKLYRFDKDGNQWKERGVGTVKLLKHKETRKVCLVMRQSKTLKICANHLMLSTMTVHEHKGNDKSCLWHATDFANDRKTFMEMFQEVAESQKSKEENKDATAVVGLLEKLSVEEKKTEDKSRTMNHEINDISFMGFIQEASTDYRTKQRDGFKLDLGSALALEKVTKLKRCKNLRGFGAIY